MADYGRWTTSSSAIGAHWRKKERLQKLETQRRRQRAREVLAHQANKEYFDSNVLQRPMGLTTTKKGAQREAFAAAYGTEWEGEDTRSDLVNVKAGITTTAAKAARDAAAETSRKAELAQTAAQVNERIRSRPPSREEERRPSAVRRAAVVL